MSIKKLELDIRVSKELSISQRKVVPITTQFIHEIRRALVEDGEVYLPGLGRLKVQVVKTGVVNNLSFDTVNVKGALREKNVEALVQHRVFFRKATALRDELNWRKRHE